MKFYPNSILKTLVKRESIVLPIFLTMQGESASSHFFTVKSSKWQLKDGCSKQKKEIKIVIDKSTIFFS